MKSPFIGQMDRKIQIVSETLSQNTMGEQKPSETVIASAFAHMEEAGGDEDVEGKVRHLTNRRYTIRFNSDILTNGNKYILKDAGVKYGIYHVNEIGRKQHLQLLVNKYE